MKKFIFFSAIVLLIFATVGCDEEETSVTTDQISGNGKIGYLNSKNLNGEFHKHYSNHFWITVGVGGCYTHLIVCNEDFLDNKFDYLKSTEETVKIKFSGEIKELSETPPPPRGPANVIYALIELTSIEKL